MFRRKDDTNPGRFKREYENIRSNLSKLAKQRINLDYQILEDRSIIDAVAYFIIEYSDRLFTPES